MGYHTGEKLLVLASSKQVKQFSKISAFLSSIYLVVNVFFDSTRTRFIYSSIFHH